MDNENEELVNRALYKQIKSMNRAEMETFVRNVFAQGYQRAEEEIDILACDETKQNYIIGECKFRNEAFDLHELDRLKAKHERKGTIYYYLFSLGGFTDSVKNLSEKDKNLFLIEPSEMLCR